MALRAADGQRAQPVGRAGGQPDRQVCTALDRVYVGQAGGYLAGRVALAGELAQRLLLGAVPARLGKAHAGSQRPVAFNLLALQAGRRIVGNRAAELDPNLTHQGRRAGRNRQRHPVRCRAAVCRAHVYAYVGREIAQRGHQLLRVLPGRRQQAGQFTFAQVGEFAVAQQFKMALQHGADLIRGLDVELERGRRWRCGGTDGQFLCPKQGGQAREQRPHQRLAPLHLVSSRMASSSPLIVSGNMR